MALYVVTGGAGFIGSHLVEELRRRGESVRVVDSLITGHRQNLDHVEGVEFVQGDLADLRVAHAGLQGADYVLHQAAIPSVPRSVQDPITSHRANATASLNVLVAARDAGVNEFLTKPLTGRGVIERITLVVDHPRPFVKCTTYVGPDRRRKVDPNFQGPQRRRGDPQRMVAAHEI